MRLEPIVQKNKVFLKEILGPSLANPHIPQPSHKLLAKEQQRTNSMWLVNQKELNNNSDLSASKKLAPTQLATTTPTKKPN